MPAVNHGIYRLHQLLWPYYFHHVGSPPVDKLLIVVFNNLECSLRAFVIDTAANNKDLVQMHGNMRFSLGVIQIPKSYVNSYTT